VTSLSFWVFLRIPRRTRYRKFGDGLSDRSAETPIDLINTSYREVCRMEAGFLNLRRSGGTGFQVQVGRFHSVFGLGAHLGSTHNPTPPSIGSFTPTQIPFPVKLVVR
jgi:hypothetical protein